MIERVSELITHSVESGGKILVCGNGGLAAESEHFAAELMGKYVIDIYVPCGSLTSNTSLLTALANDLGYENVFAHQVAVLCKPNDLLIGMTTTRSPNVLMALQMARARKAKTVVICGSRYQPSSDCTVSFHGDVGEIQNQAIQFLHLVAASAKRRISGRAAIS